MVFEAGLEKRQNEARPQSLYITPFRIIGLLILIFWVFFEDI
jgi:hypothetical protein